MKCLVVILGLLVAAVQAAPGERFSDGPTPLNVYIPLIEGAPEVPAPKIPPSPPATFGQFPHVAALLVGSSGLCGGSLIHPNWVLTAAHCGNAASSFTVRLGCTQWQASSCVARAVAQRIQHPNYNPSTLANDIALLRLSSAAPINTVIRPVALPPAGDTNTYAGVTASVCGFGWSSQTGGVSQNPSCFSVIIITNAQCAQFYGNWIMASNMCARGVEGSSHCNVDSGNGLVVTVSGSLRLIGVLTSVPIGGCTSGNPFVFSRVTSFRSWICSSTSGEIC